MQSLPKKIFRLGTPDLPPEPVPVRAGPLTAIFEPHSAFLRYLRIGDHEILRGIYPAVRHPNWDTVPLQLIHLEMDLQDDTFLIRFEHLCEDGPIRLRWEGNIQGDAAGLVTYQIQGRAETSFQQSRVGLCILHPIQECAGKPCQVETVDGQTQAGQFPKHISPHQPFRNMRAIRHEPVPGVTVEVRFEGDTFEMEDQRNWTDASFKTYAPPLDRPWPSLMEAGTVVDHRIAVSFPSPPRKILPIVLGRGAQLSITTTPVLPMPSWGLCRASHGRALSKSETERLKALSLSHIRQDVWFDRTDWMGSLHQAAVEAAALGAKLHLALHLGPEPEPELDAVATLLPKLPAAVVLCLIHQRGRCVTPDPVLASAQSKLGALASPPLLASGTDANFVELNRQRPSSSATSLPCYSLTPQVHAFDSRTMIETLAAQAMTVETLQSFAPRSAVISPITLRPRETPPSSQALAQAHAKASDPRQMSLFAAGWTLGSLSRLAGGGHLHSLTYFETTGWLGVMETDEGSPAPEGSPNLAGMVFPIYHVLADMAGYNRLYPTHSSHPLQVEGMTLMDASNRRRILVANLMDSPQEIRIKSGTCQARVRYLDESNALAAMNEPETFRLELGTEIESAGGKLALHLQPFGLARVDLL